MIWIARARRYQPGPVVGSILITLSFMVGVTGLLLMRAAWLMWSR